MPVSTNELVNVFLALGLLLLVAKTFGEISRKFGQPAVLGELVAGLVLGQTILGQIAPGAFTALFPTGTPASSFFSGFQQFAVVMFLLTAGLEMPLGAIRRSLKPATFVSMGGVIVPFVVGYLVVSQGWLGLDSLLAGPKVLDRPVVVHLFFATALAISALPVIAKTLLDLGLYQAPIGVVTMAAATIDDLIGWLLFAFILGMMPVDLNAANSVQISILQTILLTLGFAAFALLLFRPLAHHGFTWLKSRIEWPSSFTWIAMVCGLFGAAATEWIGVHALFGALIIGAALGDSEHVDQKARHSLEEVTRSIFAPIFFATVALRVDFFAAFDLKLVALVLIIACIGKVVGCGLAARWAGMKPAQAWSVGVAMNSRGAMEIVLGKIAYEVGLISESLFVALVVMAIVTSLISGPMIKWILSRASMEGFFLADSSNEFGKKGV